MKVLHVNCNYLTTVLHQTMVEHLDGQGIDSVVFAPTYDAGRMVIKPNSNVVVSECFRKWDRLWFDYKQRKIVSSLEKKVDVKSFDCIHAYTLFTDGNCAMRLAKKYGKPYVVAVRDTDVNSFFKLMPHLRPRGVRIMKNASRVFFLSTTYRDLVLNRYVPEGLREEILAKSDIVPNGIDDFWFENAYEERDVSASLSRFDDKQVKLVFAGRINVNKNPMATLAAMDILAEWGYRAELTVVGGFEDPALKDTLLSDSRVRYVPKSPKQELIGYYRESDVFVMPSHRETFGLVYAEAMSQGLPVLYTKGQGFDGQFEDGEVGYAIDSRDPADIADKLLMVLGDYERMSRHACALFRRFEWDAIVRGYAELYRTIVK